MTQYTLTKIPANQILIATGSYSSSSIVHPVCNNIAVINNETDPSRWIEVSFDAVTTAIRLTPGILSGYQFTDADQGTDIYLRTNAAAGISGSVQVVFS